MAAITLEHISPGARASLWVFGRLDELVRRGWVSEGSHAITVRGRALYDQLEATGFRPTLDQVRSTIATAQLAEPGQEQALAELILAPLPPPDLELP